jgi:hypothetical protein
LLDIVMIIRDVFIVYQQYSYFVKSLKPIDGS